MEIDAYADRQSAQVIHIDMGKHLASMNLMAAICGLCVAITCFAVWHGLDREDRVNDKLQVSENHWRNLEVEVGTLKATVENLNAKQ